MSESNVDLSDVNFGKVELLVTEAEAELLRLFVEKSAEQAQGAGPRDTGFYVDHIYALGPDSASRPSEIASLVDRDGKSGTRRSVEVEGTGPEEAVLVASADYSIYVELHRQTLYRAQEYVAAQLGSLIEQVSRQFNLGD